MLTALVTSSVSPQVNKAEEPRRALDTVKPCTLCTEALTQLVRTKKFFPELFLLGLSRFYYWDNKCGLRSEVLAWA